MQTLVIYSTTKKEEIQIATFISELLKIKQINTSLRTVSTTSTVNDLTEIYHHDIFVLIISPNFMDNANYLAEFLHTKLASDKTPLIIPILLEDIQPYHLKLGKSNRFLLNQDYSRCIEFISNTIDNYCQDLKEKELILLPSSIEDTNWN